MSVEGIKKATATAGGSPEFKRDAAETATLITENLRTQRMRALEVLKKHALLGEVAFETHVRSCTEEMARSEGYPNPKSTTLSQMQTDLVTGASSFYTYVLGIRKRFRAGETEAIQAMTTSSHVKPPRGFRAQDLQPRDLIEGLKYHHTAGTLTKSQYRIIRSIIGDS